MASGEGESSPEWLCYIASKPVLGVYYVRKCDCLLHFKLSGPRWRQIMHIRHGAPGGLILAGANQVLLGDCSLRLL